MAGMIKFPSSCLGCQKNLEIVWVCKRENKPRHFRLRVTLVYKLCTEGAMTVCCILVMFGLIMQLSDF